MDCDLTGCIGRSLVSCLVCRLALQSRPINRDLIDKFPVVSFYPFWDHFLNDCQGSYFVPCMVIFCMPIWVVLCQSITLPPCIVPLSEFRPHMTFKACVGSHFAICVVYQCIRIAPLLQCIYPRCKVCLRFMCGPVCMRRIMPHGYYLHTACVQHIS